MDMGILISDTGKESNLKRVGESSGLPGLIVCAIATALSKKNKIRFIYFLIIAK